MKTMLISLCLISVIGFSSVAFRPEPAAPVEDKIEWLSFEEMLEKQKEAPKKIFIDFYTDWCGWCKVMDQKTFTDPDVISFFRKNYYAVKFDAERKDEITVGEQTFKYVPAGRRGIHELAYVLMDRRASYPAFVTLDEKLQKIGTLRGFQEAKVFLPRLKAQLTAK